MRCLLHLLPLLLGDSLRGNELFACLLLLHDICAVILPPLIMEDQVPYLRLLIQEYLHELKRQYGINLTPKCHFLVHFPQQIIRYFLCLYKISNLRWNNAIRFGPPIRLWAMRFEAKHRVFKQWARTASYKNLCWSLAIKYQQQSAYLAQTSLTKTVNVSSGIYYILIRVQFLIIMNKYLQEFLSNLETWIALSQEKLFPHLGLLFMMKHCIGKMSS